ncbi:CASP-like protein PIMP1 [Nicotiana tomentosiformis]|uniref:CASP-like protein PIMP1 n=1 Tax=Nicotiana tomentosiformis TaxID=4098 RepID=UPI00051C2A19|nr:CASP-like protein 4D1 [Nicotiana tomentosiformis]
MEFELPQYDFNEKPRSLSKLPLVTLAARIITIACALVSVVVLKSNKVTLDKGAKLEYDYFRSYRYMLGVMVAGIIYNTLHIPFAAYYLIAKKRLLGHHSFRQFEFYGDKITFGILATAAGAALGATVDLQKVVYTDNNSKIHDFLGLMYIPDAFLVAAFVSSGISSVLSSLSLRKNE